MITFTIAIVALILGYILYGAFVERVFGADSKKITPAYSKEDGVDFVPMKWGRIFLIQFLNIAGLGPIFGAVAGAMWGPVAFYGLCLGAFLPVPFTIISQACSPFGWADGVFRKLSENIWEPVLNKSCGDLP